MGKTVVGVMNPFPFIFFVATCFFILVVLLHKTDGTIRLKRATDGTFENNHIMAPTDYNRINGDPKLQTTRLQNYLNAVHRTDLLEKRARYVERLEKEGKDPYDPWIKYDEKKETTMTPDEKQKYRLQIDKKNMKIYKDNLTVRGGSPRSVHSFIVAESTGKVQAGFKKHPDLLVPGTNDIYQSTRPFDKIFIVNQDKKGNILGMNTQAGYVNVGLDEAQKPIHFAGIASSPLPFPAASRNSGTGHTTRRPVASPMSKLNTQQRQTAAGQGGSNRSRGRSNTPAGSKKGSSSSDTLGMGSSAGVLTQTNSFSGRPKPSNSLDNQRSPSGSNLSRGRSKTPAGSKGRSSSSDTLGMGSSAGGQTQTNSFSGRPKPSNSFDNQRRPSQQTLTNNGQKQSSGHGGRGTTSQATSGRDSVVNLGSSLIKQSTSVSQSNSSNRGRTSFSSSGSDTRSSSQSRKISTTGNGNRLTSASNPSMTSSKSKLMRDHSG